MRAHLVSLLLLLACSIGTVRPASAASPVPVGFETREFIDESRSNWQNTGHRPLSTVIWYPAAANSPLTVPQVGDPAWRPYFVQSRFAVAAPLSAQGPRYPIVLLSHGSVSVNLSLGWLGAYLAQHGYIAAAVNHHGNTGAEGPPLSQGFMAPWERAADLSALLDQMLADPKFGSRIDKRRVFAAGGDSCRSWHRRGIRRAPASAQRLRGCVAAISRRAGSLSRRHGGFTQRYP